MLTKSSIRDPWPHVVGSLNTGSVDARRRTNITLTVADLRVSAATPTTGRGKWDRAAVSVLARQSAQTVTVAWCDPTLCR
jgi:hypothetical protein